MFYLNRQKDIDPVCKSYCKYNVPYTESLIQRSDNILIIPESYIFLMHELKGFRCIIWWLNVGYACYNEMSLQTMQQDVQIIHFVQSQYAWDYLIEKIMVAVLLPIKMDWQIIK